MTVSLNALPVDEKALRTPTSRPQQSQRGRFFFEMEARRGIYVIYGLGLTVPTSVLTLADQVIE
jgi:hypothetical protein